MTFEIETNNTVLIKLDGLSKEESIIRNFTHDNINRLSKKGTLAIKFEFKDYDVKEKKAIYEGKLIIIDK